MHVARLEASIDTQVDGRQTMRQWVKIDLPQRSVGCLRRFRTEYTAALGGVSR